MSMFLLPAGFQIDSVHSDVFSERGVHLKAVRFDLIDPLTGGNKWFKLMPWISRAEKENKMHLLSFGGPYSNHIAALAAIGKRYGFKTTGIIRGEEVSNVTIDRAKRDGMNFHFINRSLYQELRISNGHHSFFSQFEDILIIPEGGGGKEGREGAALMTSFIPENSNHIIVASGTGTTASGISSTLHPSQKLHVIPILKNHYEISKMIEAKNATIYEGYDFGGYAKVTAELDGFCRQFTEETGIGVEPIYTGKAFYAAFDLLKKGVFKPGETVFLIHTGGLQYQNS